MRLVAIPARVPRYLKADGTRRAAQATGNLTLPIPRVTPHPDQPTFYNGHAFVSHYVLHVLQVHEERTLPGGHFHITTVALAAGARGGGYETVVHRFSCYILVSMSSLFYKKAII